MTRRIRRPDGAGNTPTPPRDKAAAPDRRRHPDERAGSSTTLNDSLNALNDSLNTFNDSSNAFNERRIAFDEAAQRAAVPAATDGARAHALERPSALVVPHVDRLPPPSRPDRPLVVAHRLGRAGAVENSLGGLRQSKAAGVDAVEFDVRATKDGVPVVIHDAHLSRLCGVDAVVEQLAWRDLAKLQLGSSGERIPTLDEVLEETGPELAMFVELKGSEGEHGVKGREDDARDARLVRTVADTLTAHADPGRLHVLSFNPTLLARFHERAPRLSTGLLVEYEDEVPLHKLALTGEATAHTAREVMEQVGAHTINASWKLVEAGWSKRWGQVPLNLWTVPRGQEAMARRLVGPGILGLIADDAEALLRRWEAEPPTPRDDSWL